MTATRRARKMPVKDQRNAQRRRQELVDLACDLFAKYGYEATSLQDIADEFGILKGSLFHYIKSKDDLLFDIIDSVFSMGREQIWAVAHEEGSATERLRRLIVAYVVFVVDHQQAVTVWLNSGTSLTRPHLTRINREEGKDRAILADLIEQAQGEGTIPADVVPSLAALSLLGSLNWVHRWFRKGGLSATDVGNQFADLFLGTRAAAV